MNIFDSHCHLDDRSYRGDINAVLSRAHQNNVIAMMVAGIDEQSVAAAIDLAERYDGIYLSVGVHPHKSKDCNPETLARLIRLSAHPKVRAWGEIGLDFNRMYSPRKQQEHWFVRQLQAAESLDLPLILHERDSGGRLTTLLSQTVAARPLKGVVHCFSGSRQELFEYLDLGMHIGITGIVTMQQRGQKLRDLVPEIPLERLLIETDAPYLTPAPHKNKTRRNEPAFVRTVLNKVAQIVGTEPEPLAAILWDNTCRLFDVAPQKEGEK